MQLINSAINSILHWNADWKKRTKVISFAARACNVDNLKDIVKQHENVQLTLVWISRLKEIIGEKLENGEPYENVRNWVIRTIDKKQKKRPRLNLTADETWMRQFILKKMRTNSQWYEQEDEDAGASGPVG